MSHRSIAPSRARTRITISVLLVGASFAGLAPGADAHGIADDASGKSVAEFVPSGIEHMLLGWDHLLFILAVVLLAGELGRAAKLITVFVVGHSTTLIAATMAGWRVDPGWVDVVIALSIVYVGIVGMRGRPKESRHWLLFGAGVLVFGLVHGLGLSTRLQDLGLPEEGLLPRVIAFNVGIEIGQLLAIAAIVLLGKALIAALKNPPVLRRPAFSQYSSFGLAIVGAVAAVVLTGKAAEGESSYDRAVAGGSGTCEVEGKEAPSVFTGGHPKKNFFTPDETLPAEDFGHVIGDGLVTIRYNAGLAQGEWQQIQEFVDNTQYVVAGPVPDQPAALVAVTQSRVLTCDAVDIETLTKFREAWIAEYQS
jgi:hydrogenase/urease accessory protein HupE